MEIDHRPRLDVTPRQRAILDLIAKGHTNSEIAERVGLSLAGVKYQVSELLSLAGVDGRDELGDIWSARQPRGIRPHGVALAALLGLSAAAVVTVAVVARALWGAGGEPNIAPARLTEASAEAAARALLRSEIQLAGLDFEFQTPAGPLAESSFDLVSAQFSAQAESLSRPGAAPPVSLPAAPADIWSILLETTAQSFGEPAGIHAFVVLDDETGQPVLVEIFGPLSEYDGSVGRLSPVYGAGEVAAGGRAIGVEAWKSSGGWCFEFRDPAHPEVRTGDFAFCPLTFTQARDDDPLHVVEQEWFGERIVLAFLGAPAVAVSVVPGAGSPISPPISAPASGFPRAVAGVLVPGIQRVEAYDRDGRQLDSYEP